MKANESGKAKMWRGILEFSWGELKTINREKISGLYKIVTGYLAMKLSHFRKRNQKVKKISHRPGHDYGDRITGYY